MGFSWSDTITASSTKVLATHISQAKTAIDGERTKRGLAGASWARTPAAGDLINQGGAGTPDYLDLRVALDAAYDRNYCFTHLATHNATYLTTHYSANNASNLNYLVAHNFGHNGKVKCFGNISRIPLKKLCII